jgi:hypothetical protein
MHAVFSQEISILWHPIRQHGQGVVGLGWVIGRQMDGEIMHAAHITVHHELHFDLGAVTRLKDHRTDGRSRRSAPLHDFNVRLLTEAQWLVTDIGYIK